MKRHVAQRTVGLAPSYPARTIQPAAMKAPCGKRPPVRDLPPSRCNVVTAAEESTAALSQVVVHLESSQIRASQWVNRSAASYLQPDYLTLKRQILEAGGNLIPIKVRPATEPKGPSSGPSASYEIVYGHRRHQACLELGMRVLAIVETLDDVNLVRQMHAENMSRKDLSAWERGLHYRFMLASSLFPSQIALSRALGICAGDVSRALFIGDLPVEILAVFESPFALAIHDADVLRPVFASDRDAMLRRAHEISSTVGQLPSKKAIRRLTTDSLPPVGAPNSVDVRTIEVAGRKYGQIEFCSGKDIIISLALPLTETQSNLLELAMQGFVQAIVKVPHTARHHPRVNEKSTASPDVSRARSRV